MALNKMLVTKVPASGLPVLRDFAERTFRIAYQHLNHPERFEQYCAQAFDPGHIQAEWARPDSEFWWAWTEDALAAYLRLNYNSQPDVSLDGLCVQLERLYVEPALQGKGIGEEMLEHAFQQAQARNADWIWLSVWQENPAAVRFYERCGYKIFGTETFWIGEEAQTDWLMRKALNP